MTLDIQLAQKKFRPGEKIPVDLSWDFPAAPKMIELRLLWFRVGQGIPEARNVDLITIPCGSRTGRVAVHFTAPDSPYSYTGGLFGIDWLIEATTRPFTAPAVANLVISPTGEPARFSSED